MSQARACCCVGSSLRAVEPYLRGNADKRPIFRKNKKIFIDMAPGLWYLIQGAPKGLIFDM